MRILILNPNIITGGAQRVALNMAYHLEKLGNKVWLFTTLIDKKDFSDKFKQLNFIVSQNKILKKGGITSQYQNIDNLFLLLIRLLKIRWELIKIINQKKIEVVICHQQPFNWVLAFYSKCPVIWNCSEPISLWQSQDTNYFPLRVEGPNFFQNILEKTYEWLDKKIIRYGIRHILVYSELTRKRIDNLYQKKAIVINPGVESDWFSQKTNLNLLKKYKLSKTFNILQVGQFNYEKNHFLTIDVFKKIKEKIPEARLILIGEGELRRKIEEKIRAYKLKKEVILTGRLPDSWLRAFLKRADVLVFPSLIQSWGLAPFEALSLGTIPLVSENCGSAKLIQKEKIGLVMKLDSDDYYQKLLYIFLHKKELKKMARKGRDFIKNNLTYEVYARKIEEIMWKFQ